MEGVITAYNKERGFGLISQFLVEKSVYFDIIECKTKGLYIGSSVQFEMVVTKKGNTAKNIIAFFVPNIKDKPLESAF